MRIGISTAQIGGLADPSAVRAAACAAEKVGYSTIWVLDRLPSAVAPRSGYGGFDGVPLPEAQHRALDPFVVLATTAAVTSRVRIGTSVLVAPWYRPAVLARLLTSLDVISEGRLVAGLGVGWSVDEFESVGVDIGHRGKDLEAILDVLDAHWADGPIRYDTPLGRVSEAHNLLRPVQRPRPPVLLAAYTPRGLDRVARRADGWMPAGIPPEMIGPLWGQVKDGAAAYGRDAGRLELVVRANMEITDRPIEGDRPRYRGSFEQLVDDIEATRATGAHEVILGLGGDPSLDEALDVFARIAEAVEMVPVAG